VPNSILKKNPTLIIVTTLALFEIVLYFLTKNKTLLNQFQIFGINIHFYGHLIAISVLIAYLISRSEVKRRNLDIDFFDSLILFAIIGGVIGARIAFLLFSNNQYDNFADLLNISNGGLSIHGAVIGGIIAVAIYGFIKYKKIIEYLSISMPQILLAQAIGRWGNYFNKEIVGKPSNSFLAMQVPSSDVPAQYFGYQTFLPVFLFESLILVAAYIIYLILKAQNDKINGIKYYLISYGVIRFLVEFFRSDYQPIVIGLDFAQIASILMIVFAIIIFNNTNLDKSAK